VGLDAEELGRHDLPAMAEHVKVKSLIIRGIGDIDEENLDLSGNFTPFAFRFLFAANGH